MNFIPNTTATIPKNKRKVFDIFMAVTEIADCQFNLKQNRMASKRKSTASESYDSQVLKKEKLASSKIEAVKQPKNRMSSLLKELQIDMVRLCRQNLTTSFTGWRKYCSRGNITTSSCCSKKNVAQKTACKN